MEIEGRRAELTVGRVIEADTVRLGRADRQGHDPRECQAVRGAGQSRRGRHASRFRVGLPGHGIDLDLRGRSAMRGTFDYRHD